MAWWWPFARQRVNERDFAMADRVARADVLPSDAPGAEQQPRRRPDSPPAPPEPAPTLDLADPSLYLNRELSMLAFQERVLEEAEDPANPLLERVKFLSIFSSNMAEFYMVRVAGLKQQVSAGVRDLSADGLTPAEQLELVREKAQRAVSAYASRLRAAADRTRRRRASTSWTTTSSTKPRRRSPTTTSRATSIRSSRRSPSIRRVHFRTSPISSLNLAVLIRTPEGEERFARVKMPRALPRLVPVCAPEATGPHCDVDVGPSRRAAARFTSCGSSSWSSRTWTRSSRASRSSRRIPSE